MTSLSLRKLIENFKPDGSDILEIPTPMKFTDKNVEANWISVPIVNIHSDYNSWPFKAKVGFKPNEILCIHRWKIWWAIPKLLRDDHGGEGSTPPETYMILGKLEDDSYIVFMPAIDKNIGFSLEGSLSILPSTLDKLLMLNGHHISREVYRPDAYYKAIIVARGNDPFETIAVTIELLKDHLRSDIFGNSSEPITTTKPDPTRGPGPTFVDYFGWCTWDSFYTDITVDKVLNGLKSFQSTGVIPRFIILDDGWQGTTVNDRQNGYQWRGRLTSFTANFKFSKDYDGSAMSCSSELSSAEEVIETPRGILKGSIGRDPNSVGHSLQELIDIARKDHNIKSFMIWHTLTGYWAGVEPRSEHSTELHYYESQLTRGSLSESVLRMTKLNALETEPFMTEGVGLIHPDKANDFFDDYHHVLRDMGVDGVKVDVQSLVSALRSDRGGGWELVKAFHKALKRSVGRNFGNDKSNSIISHPMEFPLINCMCHSQSTLLAIAALYSSETTRLIPVVRGSDDFWPMDNASHGPHLYVNTMNSLLFSHIGLHDWDMFQTTLGKPSILHAVSRSISGGPVYVSDKPEEHDHEILYRLSFPDGKVPRPIRNALPVKRYLFQDPQRQIGVPLMIQNENPCSGLVVACFNIVGAVVENDRDNFRYLRPNEMIPPIDVSELANKGESTIFDLKGHKSDYFSISDFVAVSDILSSHSATHQTDSKYHYIGYRYSDRKLFVIGDNKKDSRIPIHTIDDTVWIAVIGEVNKYNTGGAVRDVTHGDKSVSFYVLGPGEYWFVSNERGMKVTSNGSISVDLIDMVLSDPNESESVEVYLYTVNVSSRDVFTDELMRIEFISETIDPSS